jgi:hypothetical protein
MAMMTLGRDRPGAALSVAGGCVALVLILFAVRAPVGPCALVPLLAAVVLAGSAFLGWAARGLGSLFKPGDSRDGGPAFPAVPGPQPFSAPGGPPGARRMIPAEAAGPRDGLAFERVVAELYRRTGYDVEETGRHGEGTDGGVDLVLRVPPARAGDPRLSADAGADVLVQCKDYAKGWVSVDQMRAFFGAVCGWSATAIRYASRARRGVFVTTSFFSQDARAFAEANGIELTDGRALAGQLTAAGLPVPYDVPPPQPEAPTARPACPRCRVPMTYRHPAPGETWTPFWGCPNYRTKGCRQTVKIR